MGARPSVPKSDLKTGVRVALDMTTLTVMRVLPREVDPLVYNMSIEDPGEVSFAGIGGLKDQVRELREVNDLFHFIFYVRRERLLNIIIQ